MSETQHTENKMGVQPVGRLLISMALPMMISMLVQAMYNVVDSMFVARISEDALTALTLAFPIQNLMISIGTGTGVGINALLSKSLGEKNYSEANNAARNGIFLGFLSYLIFFIFGLFFTGMFFRIQTDDPVIFGYGFSYLTICCTFSIGVFGQMIFERLLQSTGKTFYTMITQGTGAIINIIMDPILIFGWFGFPAMGVAGAAIATVLGQIVAMLMAIWFNVRKNDEIQIGMHGFRPRGQTIARIYAVGVPSIVMTSISSVTVFFMSKILMGFSSTATAVYGVYFRLQSFIFMPVFGLTNGMIPIVSYNYGAQKKDRLVQTIRFGVLYAVIIMLVGLAIFQTIPALLLSMFEASDEMLSIGIPAMRIISLSFLFAGYGITVSAVFQALGAGVHSMIISFGRQLLTLLPAAYLLSLTGSVNNIWFAVPIAEVITVALCTFFLHRTYRTIIKPIPAS